MQFVGLPVYSGPKLFRYLWAFFARPKLEEASGWHTPDGSGCMPAECKLQPRTNSFNCWSAFHKRWYLQIHAGYVAVAVAVQAVAVVVVCCHQCAQLLSLHLFLGKRCT